jgi:transcriptional regulator with PAS, ATPase and Fis domain
MMELATVMSNTSLIDDADISFSSPNRSSDFLLDSEDTLVGYNRKIIRYYLENNDNNIIKVAKKLDIGKSTIYRMMKNNEL